jgi:hypothetical protein
VYGERGELKPHQDRNFAPDQELHFETYLNDVRNSDTRFRRSFENYLNDVNLKLQDIEKQQQSLTSDSTDNAELKKTVAAEAAAAAVERTAEKEKAAAPSRPPAKSAAPPSLPPSLPPLPPPLPPGLYQNTSVDRQVEAAAAAVERTELTPPLPLAAAAAAPEPTFPRTPGLYQSTSVDHRQVRYIMKSLKNAWEPLQKLIRENNSITQRIIDQQKRITADPHDLLRKSLGGGKDVLATWATYTPIIVRFREKLFEMSRQSQNKRKGGIGYGNYGGIFNNYHDRFNRFLEEEEKHQLYLEKNKQPKTRWENLLVNDLTNLVVAKTEKLNEKGIFFEHLFLITSKEAKPGVEKKNQEALTKGMYDSVPTISGLFTLAMDNVNEPVRMDAEQVEQAEHAEEQLINEDKMTAVKEALVREIAQKDVDSAMDAEQKRRIAQDNMTEVKEELVRKRAQEDAASATDAEQAERVVAEKKTEVMESLQRQSAQKQADAAMDAERQRRNEDKADPSQDVEKAKLLEAIIRGKTIAVASAERKAEEGRRRTRRK